MLKNGTKSFSKSIMQFFDLRGLKLRDVVFEDCQMMFCTFSDCKFKDTAFRNCSMYFGSFYTGSSDKLVFEKCDIEMTLFDNFQFSNSRMHECTVYKSAVFNSNAAMLDTSTSVIRDRIITSVSQLTPEQIELSISEIMQHIERLDVGLRMKVKEMMRKDMDRYNVKDLGEKKPAYGSGHGEYSDAPLTYGEVKHAIESVFYGPKPAYKTKKSYETESSYKR